MRKIVKLEIAEFPTIPTSLQSPSNSKLAVPEIEVDLVSLYHHYLAQSFDERPSDELHLFEQIRYLMPSKEMRFYENGLGANKDKKRTTSRELGESFCLWFLERHINVLWTARIDDVRDHSATMITAGFTVESDPAVTGDAPDFFCVEANNVVTLAEAKGTMDAVGIGTKLWNSWREQFKRIRIKDRTGTSLKMKGYVIATRWAMEHHGPKIYTKLSVEDPETPGERPFFDESNGLAAAIKSIHYGPTLMQLRLPALASALTAGATIPDEWRFRVHVWECFAPKLQGMRFVGSFFGSSYGSLPYQHPDGEIIFDPHHRDGLDYRSGVFVGIEEKIFHKLVATARTTPATINDLLPLERIEGNLLGVSLLRDGRILGPMGLFRPLGDIIL